MKIPRFLRLTPLLFAVWTLLAVAGGPVRGEDALVRELRIDPSTTSVPLGKARLTVDTLTRGKNGADGLQGGYKVEVSPLSFASEEGRLTISVSGEMLRKLAGGQEVDFAGQAVSSSGSNSSVQGTATPGKDGKDSGSIRVRIDSKKGKLIFKTTYHLVR